MKKEYGKITRILIFAACVILLNPLACKKPSPMQEYKDYCLYVLDETRTVSCNIDMTLDNEILQSAVNPVAINEGNRYIRTASILYEAAPDKLKVESIQILPELLAPAFKPQRSLLLYDGASQWCEGADKENKMQYRRVKTAGITTSKRPFDTHLNNRDSGLMLGEGLLGSMRTLFRIYTMREVFTDNLNGTECIVLEGKLNEKEFYKYLEDSYQTFDNPKERNILMEKIAFVQMYFAESDYFIRKYSFGPARDRSYMTVSFSNVALNQELPPDTFVYDPPAGVEVIDVTELIKQKLSRFLSKQ